MGMSATDNQNLSPNDDITEVDGIGPARSETLNDAGYQTVSDLQDASVSELSEHVPSNVAASIKQQVDGVGLPDEAAEQARQNVPDMAAAKQRANKIPGAKATQIRVNGRPQAKVLRKIDEDHRPGATIEIRKG